MPAANITQATATQGGRALALRYATCEERVEQNSARFVSYQISTYICT